MYDHERIFMNSLKGYEGLRCLRMRLCFSSQRPSYLNGIAERLNAQGFDLHSLLAERKYFALDARAVLNKFMVGGMPDSKLFNSVVETICRKAVSGTGRLHAFGEMVVLLWEEGNQNASLRLEALWNAFPEQRSLTLFCAYSSVLLGKADLRTVCCAHSTQIGGWPHASTEIFYSQG